jgi:hypothetical protein
MGRSWWEDVTWPRGGLWRRNWITERCDYWIHGLALAKVARMVSEGKAVQAGLHFLADAVDPVAFMTELREAGVDQIENLEQSTL